MPYLLVPTTPHAKFWQRHTSLKDQSLLWYEGSWWDEQAELSLWPSWLGLPLFKERKYNSSCITRWQLMARALQVSSVRGDKTPPKPRARPGGSSQPSCKAAQPSDGAGRGHTSCSPSESQHWERRMRQHLPGSWASPCAIISRLGHCWRTTATTWRRFQGEFWAQGTDLGDFPWLCLHTFPCLHCWSSTPQVVLEQMYGPSSRLGHLLLGYCYQRK